VFRCFGLCFYLVLALFSTVFRLFHGVAVAIVFRLFRKHQKTLGFQRNSHCMSVSQAMRFAATNSRRNVFMSVRALADFPLRSISPRASHSEAHWSRCAARPLPGSVTALSPIGQSSREPISLIVDGSTVSPPARRADEGTF
jgi:hypothetical protein